MKRKNLFIAYIVLIFYAIIVLFPFYWTLVTSFKAEKDIYSTHPIWFPKPTIKYYISLLQWRPQILRYLTNSLIVALCVTLLSVAFSIPAAYGFAKLRNRINRIGFGVVLGSRLFPPIAFIVPFSIIYMRLGLIDTKLGLILVYLFFSLPFAVWIIEGFFASIPSEIEDAAMIDGCNKIDIFWRVDVPLTRSGIVAAAILSFLNSWCEYPFALTLMRRVNLTLPVGIVQIYKDDFIIWNNVAAATIISIIPGVIFVLAFQKFMVRGITRGAVKG